MVPGFPRCGGTPPATILDPLLSRGEFHYPRPLLGIALPHRAELIGCHENGPPADLSKPRGDARIGEPGVDLAVERGDDRARRAGGERNARPAAHPAAPRRPADRPHVR